SRSHKKDDNIEGQMSFFDTMVADAPRDDRAEKLVNELKDIDVNNLTPIEALNKLSELRKKADEFE
ncbi:MAG: hypothetical protein II133_00140, partial [Lachnospiraceae bacterium]|nr:hypothetical protein [Lachnospiraceae bacterium]